MITFSDIILMPSDTLKKGRDQFIVVEPIVVTLNNTTFCTIPFGFISDGASLRWYFRGKWSSWGKLSGPALLHDYLLTNTNLPKWYIDSIFYIAMRSKGVPALQAALFWLAVRVKRSRD